MKERSLFVSFVVSIAIVVVGGCDSSGGDNSFSDPSSGSGGSNSVGYNGGTTGSTTGSTTVSVSKGPGSEYIGSWVGTWTYGGATTNHGGISFTIDSNGVLSGKMLYASATARDVLGPGTISGQVNGSNVTFVMNFSTSLACTGTFSSVVDGQTKVSFTIDDSRSVAGSFTVTKQ